MLALSEPLPGVALITAPTYYEIAATFLRPQEFYESPHAHIRGQYFTREEYEDLYAKKWGNNTYTSDFDGFNIPADQVRQFYSLFTDLSRKEMCLKATLLPMWLEWRYVIGAKRGDIETINHEMAHALWHTNDEYRAAMLAEVRQCGERAKYRKYLKGNGYSSHLFDDETQAYAATMSRRWATEHGFVYAAAKPFRRILKRHLPVASRD